MAPDRSSPEDRWYGRAMEESTGWTGSAAARAGAVLALLAGSLVPALRGPAAGAAEPANATETSAGIARAIEQLGAPQFARREASARALVQAGRPALGPLADAAAAADLEVASRAVEILRELLAAADPDLAAAASATLAAIADRQGAPVAALAAAALEFHRAARAESARERLTALGGLLSERAVDPTGVDLEAEFGAAWHGTPEDLRELAHLERLACVRVYGVPLDDAAVEILGSLPALRRIDLYGTSLGPAAIAALEARLPGAVIDARKGGKLGVRSVPAAGSCQISHVQPGSAAERAGLRPGDVIEHVDGRPVASFDEFTRLMARLGPGEAVSLGVARENETGDVERIEPTVRLDAW